MYVLDANLLSNYIAIYERPMKYKQFMWEQNENLVLTYSWPSGTLQVQQKAKQTTESHNYGSNLGPVRSDR